MPAATTKPKVLVVANQMSEGGAERFTSNLLNAIDPGFFSLNLCLLDSKQVFEVPTSVKTTFLVRKRFAAFYSWVFQLASLIRRERPDLILSTIGYTNALTGCARAFAGCTSPWILRVGYPDYRFSGKIGFLSRYFYRRAYRVIANSRELADDISRYMPTLHNVYGVLNPVDLALLERSIAEPAQPNTVTSPYICWVGRLVEQKRPDLAVEIFCDIAARTHRPIKMIMLGEGVLREALSKQIHAAGMQDRILLPGFVNNPYSIIHKSELLLFTSRMEGMPNILIEAQALGIPVVSSDCDFGPREIVDDCKSGYLVDVAASATHYLDPILSLLEQSDLRKSMQLYATKMAREKFDLEHLTKEWLRHITSALEAK